MSAFRVTLGAIDLKCAGVPLNPTHSQSPAAAVPKSSVLQVLGLTWNNLKRNFQLKGDSSDRLP